MRGGNSSVVRAPDWIVIDRSRVRVLAGAAGEYASLGSTFCADSYFGIRSTRVTAVARKILIVLPKVKVAGYT